MSSCTPYFTLISQKKSQLDGEPIEELNVQQLRQGISFVSQEPTQEQFVSTSCSALSENPPIPSADTKPTAGWSVPTTKEENE